MGETFTVVIVGAIALFALVGVVSWLAGGSIYDQIGEGGLTAGPGEDPGGSHGSLAPVLDAAAARAERDLEIRQMLTARSERLIRAGGEPLDIETELAKLAGPDPASPNDPDKDEAVLAEEVRQLVVARNERRERRGEEPLDVESEVQRTLAELKG